MKFRVITIRGFEPSESVADRCIKSASRFGIHVEKHTATRPEDSPAEILLNEGIPLSGFQEKWSKTARCQSAFLSHYFLWKKCIKDNEPYCIFEHDAVVVDNLPLNVQFDKLMSIGKPSYGKYNVPANIGVNKLTSKMYLPGAHAYMIKPAGAKQLVERAKTDAGPTDVFMHIQRFPWLQEYYPWPVEVRESFTTIQKELGTRAKHLSNRDQYQIL